ncbi:MAG: polyhydroxybutyrate depolymerase [Acidimicrobiaceae bacterium]
MLLAGACSNSKAATSPNTTSTAAASTTTTVLDPANVAAVPSAGCTGSTTVAAGETTTPFSAAGVDGSSIRHIPPVHDGRHPIPLVLDLHGYSEPAAIHAQLSALGPFGDQHGFVTLTPETTAPVPQWDTALGSADLKWLSALLDDAESKLCIDTARVFTTGLSNGAMMTSSVACDLSDRIAAVAPVAGVTLVDGCTPARPVPLVAFHGTADQYVAYDGGLGPAVANLPAPDGSGKTLGELGVGVGGGPTVPEIVAGWATRNGCASTPQTTQPIAADVDLLVFACPPGADAELYRVTGGGHTWPGSVFAKAIESIVGHTTDSISANEKMWAFFEAHPLTR